MLTSRNPEAAAAPIHLDFLSSRVRPDCHHLSGTQEDRMDDGLLAMGPHQVLSEVIMPSRQEMMDGPCLPLRKQVSQGHGSPRGTVLHSGRKTAPAPHFRSPGAAGPLSIVAPKELELRFWAQVTLGE